jgi:hypothetical protein
MRKLGIKNSICIAVFAVMYCLFIVPLLIGMYVLEKMD